MDPAKLNLNPMTQIDPVLIVATILIVAVIYFSLRRVFVLPYLRVIEERERLFEVADVQAAEAEESLEAAKAAAEQTIAESAAEAESIRAEAQESSERHRRTRIADATSAASARLEEGRAKIAAARTVEAERLRGEAVECVGVACQQLLGRAEDEAVAATVERLIGRQAE